MKITSTKQALKVLRDVFPDGESIACSCLAHETHTLFCAHVGEFCGMSGVSMDDAILILQINVGKGVAA